MYEVTISIRLPDGPTVATLTPYSFGDEATAFRFRDGLLRQYSDRGRLVNAAPAFVDAFDSLRAAFADSIVTFGVRMEDHR